MDAAGQLAQLLERVLELLPGGGQVGAGALGIGLEAPLDHAQLQRERHEPLLGAVVEVALQTAALGVAGLHDARPGACELVVGVRVGQGLRHELGEVLQAPLRAADQVLGLGGRGHQHAPQPGADGDRSGHRGPVAEAAQALGERSRRVVVVVDALRMAAAVDAGDDRVPVEVDRGAQRQARHAGVAPAADHRGAAVVLVAQDGGAGSVEQAGHLLGDPLEHRARRGLAGDERGDAAQGGLLVGQGPRRQLAGHQALLGLARLGDVAHRRDDALGSADGVEDGRRADPDPGRRAVRSRHASRERGLHIARAQRLVAQQATTGHRPIVGVHRGAEDVLGPAAAQSMARRGRRSAPRPRCSR